VAASKHRHGSKAMTSHPEHVLVQALFDTLHGFVRQHRVDSGTLVALFAKTLVAVAADTNGPGRLAETREALHWLVEEGLKQVSGATLMPPDNRRH
jgi:hypothetical protein